MLKKRFPQWSSTEVMKRVSIAWSHMKREEKTRYALLAQIDKRRYEKEMKEQHQWEESHGKQIFTNTNKSH